MTPAYAAPEQYASLPGAGPDPRVGPWSDVHALAATAFFVLAGEAWCRDEWGDREWRAGLRRGLPRGRLDPSLASRPALVAAIDEALARGASPRPPGGADAPTGAGAAAQPPARFASVEGLAAALFPLLDEAAGGRTA